MGWMGKALKIGVVNPPEKGKANEAMRKVLAGFLGFPKNQICIIKGETTSQKVIEVLNMEESEFSQKLKELIGKKPKGPR